MPVNKDALIHKVLSGTATDVERAAFESWVSNDPTNAEAYEEIKLLFEASLDIEEKIGEREPYFYDGLVNIQRKIARLKRRRKTTPFLIAGALAVMVVSSSIFFYRDAYWEYIRMGNDAPMLKENLSFENNTLQDITDTLEEKFDVVFSVSSTSVLRCRFTGTFYKGTTVDELVRTLARSEGLDYKVSNGQTYELLGDGCQL